MALTSGRPSSQESRLPLLATSLCLTALGATALIWSCRRGYTLYYGDAEAHLNIARRLFDSRTPGLQQVGTVWLPIPHLLMMPFARFDALWQSGLAGAIPAAGCFVAAGAFLFAAARRLYGDIAAAATTVAVFALNPNLLYLQSTPMTEPIFFAALGGLFYCAVRLHETPRTRFVVGAGVATLVASLTRYEGWFLIPFVALYVLYVSRGRKALPALLFLAIAVVGPVGWLVHNWRWWGDCFAFLRGTRPVDGRGHPGSHSWLTASLYYGGAIRLCAGAPLLLLAAAGAFVSRKKRSALPLLLLLPAPLFYIWTIHSSGIRLFVPQLAPFSAYNTRYGLAALPFLAVACGALVAHAPSRWRLSACAATTLLAISPGIAAGWPDSSACWKEARDTSQARRAWTHEAAAFLHEHYRRGDGIATSFGDLTGALREAGIPLRETLTQDNGSRWQAAVEHPAMDLRERWAFAAAGDTIANVLGGSASAGRLYERVENISEKGAPTISIYKRNGETPTAVQYASAAPRVRTSGPEANRGHVLLQALSGLVRPRSTISGSLTRGLPGGASISMGLR